MCATAVPALQLFCSTDTLGPRPHGIESPLRSSGEVLRLSAPTFVVTADHVDRHRRLTTAHIPSAPPRET
jgi:hypothetical protein